MPFTAWNMEGDLAMKWTRSRPISSGVLMGSIISYVLLFSGTQLRPSERVRERPGSKS